MIKVRFNLSKGVNYMKWKISYSNTESLYLDPSEHSLIMYRCILRNQKGTAKKIYEGANKRVCAWIDCEELDIVPNSTPSTITEFCYNPRVNPYWTWGEINVDGLRLEKLKSHGNKVYLD